MASGDAVQQIKDRLNILDVVGAYVELHRAGKHFKGRCPFHGEKTPSFHVSPERGTFHCFGCGVGGDIFSFTQQIDGVDFKEALKTLAQKAGVELVPEAPEKRTEREQLVAALEAATKFFAEKLPYAPEAVAYLEKRGVSKETIAKWRIGYAPGPPVGGWRELKAHLNALGFTDRLLLQAGLIKQPEGGKEPFDVFRDRVMFPLRDASGRIVAFSGRILHPDEKSPKYVNSPETELYHKSELLYGYDLAKHNLRQLPFWLIVEGQFDVVMSHQAGYSTAVAVSGTALTDQHVSLLERLSKNVVLALDADKAGIAAMKKAAAIMLRRGMDVKVAVMPEGADPADMIAQDSRSFKVVIGHSVTVVDFLLQYLKQQFTDERTYKLRVRDELLPLIAHIPNRIDQEHFGGVIADAVGTTKEAVLFEVERHRVGSSASVAPATAVLPSAPVRPPKDTHERRIKLLGTLVAAAAIVSEKEAAVIQRVVSDITEVPWETVVAMVPAALVSELTFTIETQFENISPKVWQSDLVHTINQLKSHCLKAALQQARAQIEGSGGEAADVERVRLISQRLREPAFTEAIFTL